jgi:c-di-GMP-binding flagellar brake protein YcgR
LTDPAHYLQLGEILQLQHAPPSTNTDRFSVKLLGYHPDQSLIITTPRKHGNPIIVRDGHTFTVRLLQGSNIIAFQSQVLLASAKPYPHLHLSYPDEVESAMVRNAARVPIELDAQVLVTLPSKKQVRLDVLVTDLSTSGAGILSPKQLGKVGDRLQVYLRLEVCGGKDNLQLHAFLRNLKEVESEEGETRYLHGVQFAGLNRFQQLLLCGYVLSQVSQGF